MNVSHWRNLQGKGETKQGASRSWRFLHEACLCCLEKLSSHRSGFFGGRPLADSTDNLSRQSTQAAHARLRLLRNCMATHWLSRRRRVETKFVYVFLAMLWKRPSNGTGSASTSLKMGQIVSWCWERQTWIFCQCTFWGQSPGR